MSLKEEFIALAKVCGADLVGVAPVSRFAEGDPVFKILPSARSVIGIAFRILRGTYRGTEEGTTFYQYTTMAVENMEETVMPIALLRLSNFLEEKGFTPQLSEQFCNGENPFLSESNQLYYRDYVFNPRPQGYRSLHITFYDNLTRCYTEVQLRTKDMDDYAEIGDANHFGYEKRQEKNSTGRDIIPLGECKFFDEAYERLIKLQELNLAEIDVNMFKAYNNQLINDGCGLFRGRQILPFEHLSRFQNDLIG